MTFPSTTGTKQDSLAVAWARARDTAAGIKNQATNLRTASVNGNVGASAILSFATYLADAKLILVRSSSTGGIGAYAQSQINDGTIVVATEFNNMMTTLDSVIAWIIANFPKDGSGFLLAVQFAADNSGRTTDRQFSTAALANFRTTLDTLIATID